MQHPGNSTDNLLRSACRNAMVSPGELCERVERHTAISYEQANRYFMQSVLFKTSEPAAAEGMVEFYIVSLGLQDINQKVSVVEEIHGWWSNQARKATLDREFASPPEVFGSFGDAIDRYCALRVNRAKAGFVHSFSWDGFVGDPSNYKRIDPSVEPRLRSSNGSGE